MYQHSIKFQNKKKPNFVTLKNLVPGFNLPHLTITEGHEGHVELIKLILFFLLYNWEQCKIKTEKKLTKLKQLEYVQWYMVTEDSFMRYGVQQPFGILFVWLRKIFSF